MTVRVLISGYVQGVGFRYFIKQNAQNLGLRGWVRNTDDGKVEALFQGEEKSISKMIDLCKKGPFLSEVKNVETEPVIADKLADDFRITS